MTQMHVQTGAVHSAHIVDRTYGLTLGRRVRYTLTIMEGAQVLRTSGLTARMARLLLLGILGRLEGDGGDIRIDIDRDQQPARPSVWRQLWTALGPLGADLNVIGQPMRTTW